MCYMRWKFFPTTNYAKLYQFLRMLKVFVACFITEHNRLTRRIFGGGARNKQNGRNSNGTAARELKIKYFTIPEPFINKWPSRRNKVSNFFTKCPLAGRSEGVVFGGNCRRKTNWPPVHNRAASREALLRRRRRTSRCAACGRGWASFRQPMGSLSVVTCKAKAHPPAAWLVAERRSLIPRHCLRGPARTDSPSSAFLSGRLPVELQHPALRSGSTRGANHGARGAARTSPYFPDDTRQLPRGAAL